MANLVNHRQKTKPILEVRKKDLEVNQNSTIEEMKRDLNQDLEEISNPGEKAMKMKVEKDPSEVIDQAVDSEDTETLPGEETETLPEEETETLTDEETKILTEEILPETDGEASPIEETGEDQTADTVQNEAPQMR